MPLLRSSCVSSCLGLLTCLALPSLAQELRVTTPLDETDGACTVQHCSLREAVAAANAAPSEASLILLGPGTYRLALANRRGAQDEVIEEDANLVGDLDVLGQAAPCWTPRGSTACSTCTAAPASPCAG
jgi:CSLREA domain-containing protein